jgi:hypothetical protein
LTLVRLLATIVTNQRSPEVKMDTDPRRVLVVANRTASTPLLLDAVRERARQGPCSFTLLIPDEPRKGGADWTLDTAVPLLERAAGGPVEGIVGDRDPFEAVRAALAEPGFDEGPHLDAAPPRVGVAAA